jgi:hypothetical protein
LESIGAACGGYKFEFAGERLNRMVRWAGEPFSSLRTVELTAGETAVVFLMLKLENASEVPDWIVDNLHLRSPDAIDHVL